MRNTLINIYEASQDDRIKLYNHLSALGEEIYSNTGLRDKYYSYSQFEYDSSSSQWVGSGSLKNLSEISINDFIKKFIKPVVATPELISTTATSEKEPEMDIKVGDVYKNSSGNLNTITRIVSYDYIYYTVPTGREYHTKLSVIQRNWKKVVQPATDQSTTVPKYLDRTDIKTGDYVERTKSLSLYDDVTPAFVAKTKNGDEISLVGSSKGFWDMDNFKVINPLHPSHPNYVNPNYTTPSSESITTSTTKILQPLTEYLKTNSIKVGDVLKINTDLNCHHNTNASMNKLAGELVTIISTKSRLRSGLDIKGAGNNYWDTSMFEAIEIEVPVSTVARQSSFNIEEDIFGLDINSSVYTKYPKGFMFIGPSGVLLEVEKVDTFKDGSPRHLIIYSTTRTTYCTNATEDFIAEEVLKHTKTIAINGKKIKTMAAVATTTGITIQPQIKKESEKKSMSKAIKDTALQTVGDNKQALIIAGKMEAGRVLNKQVLKQIKPHIPMFVRGYLDTPLAPVIVANLVAAVGNHTQNKRVQQVAELMLLAAADTTVQSFNIDKIIDDVLAGVKLPAGVLDTDEE